MNPAQSRTLIEQTFRQSFDKTQFQKFAMELLHRFDESKAQQWNITYIKDAFKEHVNRYERLGTYTAPGKEKLDILIVHLAKESKLSAPAPPSVISWRITSRTAKRRTPRSWRSFRRRGISGGSRM